MDSIPHPAEIEQQRQTLKEQVAKWDGQIVVLHGLLEQATIERHGIQKALSIMQQHFPEGEPARPRLSLVGP